MSDDPGLENFTNEMKEAYESMSPEQKAMVEAEQARLEQEAGAMLKGMGSSGSPVEQR